MSVIRASVTDQVLKITESPIVASGGWNEVKIKFTFCEKWDGFVKVATFYRDEGETYAVPLEDNACVVPWEVCSESGTFYIGVFGDKDGVVRTSTTVKYKVKKGAPTDGTSPSEPTPDRYTQLSNEVDRIADELLNHAEQAVHTDAILFSPQELDDAKKAQARKNIGALSGTDTNIHAAYFQITEAGVLSLKPEYRGAATKNTYPDAISDNGVGVAGSKNAELPTHLVIPEVVGDVAVASFVNGMLYGNKAIKAVTLPNTITRIPESCFNECLVEVVHNIENVTYVGAKAFRNSNIRSAWMPNLTAMGNSAFCQCSLLTHIHIGKVVDIYFDTFYKCRYLSRIESDGRVATIGTTAFMNTNRLVNANIAVEKLTSLEKGAFIQTGWDADWSKLTITPGTNAVCTQYNPTDFWSACTFTPCENPLPTLLTQWDERWKNTSIGNASGTLWGAGCQLFSIMHIYCGLNNLKLNHVDEFAQIVEGIKPGHMSTFASNFGNVKPFCKELGLTVTEYMEFNQANLQALFDALARGAYAVIGTSDGNNIDKIMGHAIVVYGVTESGKLLIADSDYRYCNDRTVGVTYAVPYKTVCEPDYKSSNSDVTFCIIEKA